MLNLGKDVKFIKGVGPNRVVLLNKLGIYTLGDLITYYPREYEDRSKPRTIAQAINGEEILIKAIAISRVLELRVRKNMCMYKVTVNDGTANCYITWFNQSYVKNIIKLGGTYYFYGKISIKNGKIEMSSPVFDVEEKHKNTGKIIPIYPSTFQLSQNTLRQIIENGLQSIEGDIEETMPEYLLKEYGLINLDKAITQIHFPENFENYNSARKRLVFEELLTMQMGLLGLKNKNDNEKLGVKLNSDVKISDVIDNLPFKLTKAQLKVLEEIDEDLEKNLPMNRLLQGDVGSGKTIISIICAYKAVKSGYQVAIMAPTSILAIQHLESFREILEKYGIKCELLISSITKKNKENILERLANRRN